jgi:Protein of unknown function (DUF3014)
MSELNDLHLDKWQSPPEPERASLGWRLAVAAALLLGLLAAAYFLLWRRTQPQPQDVKVHTEQTVAQTPGAKPVAEPGAAIDLPPLEQTDPIVRELVGRLSSHPNVAAWLTTDQLLRNFSVVVLNISNGRTPSRQLSRVRPAQGFQVRKDASGLWIDPRSYARYDGYADAVAALDARGAAQLYATLKPRIQDGYRELGYPEGDFDRVLERAIVELLKTPVIEGNVALASKSVAYEFADPRLESLSSAQRQFLRMGPRNVKIIQGKLREIAPLAGLSAGQQP